MLDLERGKGGKGGSSYLAIGGEAESRLRGSGRERAREKRERGGGERYTALASAAASHRGQRY